MIDKLAKLPLAVQPGTDWRYGPSVDIQGYVVEKLSGQSLDVFLRTKIFEPLGMKDTGFWVDASKVDRVTSVFTYGPDKRLIPRRSAGTTSDPSSKPVFLSGSGGLLSTTDDYFRFAQMMLNGGEANGKRFLKASTVELMRTNVLAEGVKVDTLRPQSAGHRLRAGLRDRHGSCRGEHPGGSELLLLGRRVRHLVLDRSDQRCRRRGDDAERQRQHADRRLAPGATAVPTAGVSGVGGSEEVISRRAFLGTTAGAGLAVARLAAQAPPAALRRRWPRARPDARQRPHPHDGRPEHRRDHRDDPQRPLHGRRQPAPRGRISGDARDRPARAHGRPRNHRAARSQRSLANRPGYHTILENTTSIREIQEALAARRKNVPEGQWITSMGGGTRTSGPSTVIRR